MQDFDCNYTQMTSPFCGCPMTEMNPQQLESMYPKTYQIIRPAVEEMCDRMEATHGKMFVLTRSQLEAMIDDVYSRVEVNVNIAVNESSREEERQFFGRSRRLLRDFIGALLIGGLIRRRRPFFFGHPGFLGYPYFY